MHRLRVGVAFALAKLATWLVLPGSWCARLAAYVMPAPAPPPRSPPFVGSWCPATHQQCDQPCLGSVCLRLDRTYCMCDPSASYGTNWHAPDCPMQDLYRHPLEMKGRA
jgi:hypothetical protein